MKKTIYVTGLPRSMSTLMCNLLANNERIGGGETSPLLEYIYGATKNYSQVPEVKAALTKEIVDSSFIEFCRHGIDGYAKSITEKEIYVDKGRGWLHYSDLLREIIPDAKIIVMVRDIRSIISSMEKKWRQNPFVIDSREIPSKQQFVTISERTHAWINDPPLGLALKRLFNAVQTNTIKNMFVVKAEDLCKYPKETMQKVYDFIREPYCDLDYNNIKQVTVENDRIAEFSVYGDHKIRSKVEILPKDYDSILGKEVSASIKSSCNWFYETFGYF